MEIRKSTEQDIPAILDIYDSARKYMRAHGNMTQWSDGYPGRDILERDIREKNSYVMVENGEIVGTFSFIIGEEPTYRVIKNGQWNADQPYGTIHRLASNGKAKGIARECFDFCTGQIDYVRIDTHRDNLSMQTAILRYGFRKCGNIYVRDGSERIAYDFRESFVTATTVRDKIKIYEIQNRNQQWIEELLKIWEGSVRATHLFLSDAEVNNIKEYVPRALTGVEHLLIAEIEMDKPVAFMGIQNGRLEMLFIAPEERGKGIGRQLLQYGFQTYGIHEVTVNEQNPQAVGFYEHMGFKTYKRTDLDEEGNPYPLLYMKHIPF